MAKGVVLPDSVNETNSVESSVPAVPRNGQRSELLQAALSYAARGWSVFPLYEPLPDGKCSCGRTDCANVGKHPRTAHGVKDAITDQQTIQAWWKRWPNANIGVATGRGSRLVVLDVDRPEALARWQADTLTAKSGKGWHYYFLLDGSTDSPVKTSARKLGEGLDVRGDGGYVVAPQSQHASGATYTWLDSDRVPEPAPSWLVCPNPIPQGERNDTLFRIGAAMRGDGRNFDEILSELDFENSTRCVLPLEYEEVRQIAESVMRYEPDAAASFVCPEAVSAGMSLPTLLARTRQEPDWIIPGLLKRNNTMFIVGEPKRACKSWLLGNLAWDLAEEKPVWGIHHSKNGYLFVPKRPMRVIYFSQEDEADDFQDRAELITSTGRQPNDNFWFVPKNLQMTLDSENGAQLIERELEAAARTAPLDLVLFDPLRRILQGDESNSERIAEIWRRLDDWSKEFNCSFIIAHHVVKPPRTKGEYYDPSSPYVSRGSSDIYAGADAFINVVPKNQQGRSTKGRLVELYFTTKRSREISPVSLRVNFDTGGVEFVAFLNGRKGDDENER